MDLLKTVNRFCDYNEFLPAELYTIGLGQVIVRYETNQNKEFNSFVLKLDEMSYLHILSYSIISYDDFTIRIKKADR